MDCISYNNNFLKEVIARVDFKEEIASIRDELPETLKEEFLSLLPVSEERQRFSTEVKISAKQQAINTSKVSKEWLFHSIGRKTTAKLNSNFIALIYEKYETFEILKEQFLHVLKSLYHSCEDLLGGRFGLRYINEIQVENGDPLDLSKFLNKNLLYPIKKFPEHNKLSRLFHNSELNFGDHKMKIKFGIFNPDYPAIIKKKTYILDFDMFILDDLTYSDIETRLDSFHSKIQSTFEIFITDNLRRVMNE